MGDRLMPYPDNFSSRAYAETHERRDSAAKVENDRIAGLAVKILSDAFDALVALRDPPGARTESAIAEAVAALDEHRSAVRVAAEHEGQDL